MYGAHTSRWLSRVESRRLVCEAVCESTELWMHGCTSPCLRQYVCVCQCVYCSVYQRVFTSVRDNGTPCVAVLRSSGMSWEAQMAPGSSI